MKLKYYLRGLGIGMIVTALILGISFSHRQGQETQILTDDQIRERAEQLGMVDSSELTLAALQNSVQQQAQENTEKTEASPEPETEETTTTSEPETTVAPENTMEPETTAAPENIMEPETTAAPENTVEPEATPQPETIAASETSQTVTVTVKKGASSGSVSNRLQEAGLVEDAKTFDNYLCNNGYSRSINPGTYEIVPGTSEEEIAKIITGKH